MKPLCTAGVVSIPALVLPEFPSTSGHRCIHPSLAEYETVRVSASQADSGSPVQGEGERCSSPTHSPVLAIPDMVLRADSSSVSATLGDYDQAGPALSASGQDLASEIRDLEAVGMAHPGPRALISSLPAEVQETIASARAPATRKLYSSKSQEGTPIGRTGLSRQTPCKNHPMPPRGNLIQLSPSGNGRDILEYLLGTYQSFLRV